MWKRGRKRKGRKGGGGWRGKEGKEEEEKEEIGRKMWRRLKEEGEEGRKERGGGVEVGGDRGERMDERMGRGGGGSLDEMRG